MNRSRLPLRLELDGDALVANWRWLKSQGGSAACGAAVKADGYGLGAVEVSRRLAAAGCADFFVTTLAEAEPLLPAIGGASISVLHGLGAHHPSDFPDRIRPVLNTPLQVGRWR